MAALSTIASRLQADRVPVEDITLRRPTLDDVFLRLTGHRAEEADPGGSPESPDSPGSTGDAQMEAVR